ncbi:MAG: outer membrane beta-barrel protein [Ignavibacteriaceae bacterium]
MKQISVIFFVVFALAFTTKLFSQSEKENKLGIGISLDPARIGQVSYYNYDPQFGLFKSTVTNATPIMFYLPINVAGRFRLEPSFGLYTINNDNTTTSTYPGTAPTTNTNSASLITIGLRGVYLSSLSKSFELYFGPRLDFSFVSSSNVYSQVYTHSDGANTTVINNSDSKETDINMGIVFGAEYFPISHYSVGGEVSLNYTTFGNPTITNTTSPPQTPPAYTNSNDVTQYSFNTEALFFMRWYFL